MSLQDASASVRRLARYEPGVVAELPEESFLRIEANGELAGVVQCFPDAPGEFALGWAFMHGFFGASDQIDSVTVVDDRVSLMVETETDIRERRFVVAGWTDGDLFSDVPRMDRRPPWVIHADVLMDVVQDAFTAMADDRARDGFIHAALASDTGVRCVARDREPQAAVAKIAGWKLRDGNHAETPILIVRGMIDRLIVQAMSRLGVSMVVTTGILTSEAFREAMGRDISVIGMARSQRPGLLVDAGHVVEDDGPLEQAIE